MVARASIAVVTIVDRRPALVYCDQIAWVEDHQQEDGGNNAVLMVGGQRLAVVETFEEVLRKLDKAQGARPSYL